LALVYLLIWYFAAGRPQARYVKERLGTDYPRKAWGKPLLVAIALFLAYVVIAVVAVMTVVAVGGLGGRGVEVASLPASLISYSIDGDRPRSRHLPSSRLLLRARSCRLGDP